MFFSGLPEVELLFHSALFFAAYAAQLSDQRQFGGNFRCVEGVYWIDCTKIHRFHQPKNLAALLWFGPQPHAVDFPPIPLHAAALTGALPTTWAAAWLYIYVKEQEPCSSTSFVSGVSRLLPSSRVSWQSFMPNWLRALVVSIWQLSSGVNFLSWVGYDCLTIVKVW